MISFIPSLRGLLKSFVLLLLSLLLLTACNKNIEQKASTQTSTEKPTNNSVYFFHDFVAIENSFDNLNPKYVEQADETIDIIPHDIDITNNILELNYLIKNKSEKAIQSIFVDSLVYLHNPEFGDNSEFILLIPLNYDSRPNLTIDGQDSVIAPGDEFNFKVQLPLSKLNLISGTPTSITNFLDNGKYKFIALRTIKKIIRFNDGTVIDTAAKDPEVDLTMLDPVDENAQTPNQEIVPLDNQLGTEKEKAPDELKQPAQVPLTDTQ